MSSLAANISHGKNYFPISDLEEAPNAKGLDAVRQRWIAPSRDSFIVDEEGRISPFPGYAAVFIDDAKSAEKLPGQLYEFDLKGTGLLQGRDKWIMGRRSQPEQGWDTQAATIYTRTPEAFQSGLVHPSIATLWAESRESEREIGDVHRVDLTYKGLIPVAGVAKPYKRDISVNSATLSNSEPLRVLVRQPDGTYILTSAPGGYFNFESPRLQVTDSYLSLTAPPTDSIPGNWTPPDAPAVRTALTSSALADPIVIPNILEDTEYSINVPSGWVLKSITADKHANAAVWLIQLTTEFIRQRDPRI
jgi:hypothetical protein